MLAHGGEEGGFRRRVRLEFVGLAQEGEQPGERLLIGLACGQRDGPPGSTRPGTGRDHRAGAAEGHRHGRAVSAVHAQQHRQRAVLEHGRHALGGDGSIRHEDHRAPRRLEAQQGVAGGREGADGLVQLTLTDAAVLDRVRRAVEERCETLGHRVLAAYGGPEALRRDPEKIPQVHIRGDINAPWRCIAGAIYNVQISGYPTVGFISTPVDPNG